MAKKPEKASVDKTARACKEWMRRNGIEEGEEEQEEEKEGEEAQAAQLTDPSQVPHHIVKAIEAAQRRRLGITVEAAAAMAAEAATANGPILRQWPNRKGLQ